MTHQTWSRSERRTQRRQVLVLLAVVVAVALGSFALGVIVGRTGDREATTQAQVIPAPQHLPVVQQSPPAPAAAPAKTSAEAVPPADVAPSNLTFYDSLPRGEQPPLGSGINLPPATPAIAPAAPAAGQVAPGAPASAAKVASRPVPAVAPSAAGDYLVQAASFARADDAGLLQARLAKRGFTAFVQQADLGPKGTWYRVFVGPLPSQGAARQVVDRLKAEEKLSALIRKR